MNIPLIILGVILIVIAYILYQYLIGNSSVVNSSTYLTPTKPSVPLSSLGSTSSTRYAYSFWLYAQTSTQTPIIVDTSNLLKKPTQYIFNVGNMYIYVDTTATLAMYVGDESVTGTKIYTLMPNFPLQKWNYIVISFDNTICDVYINGKLLTSIKISKLPTIGLSDSIIFSPIDAYIASFKMLSKPMDPTTAWSNYLSGNGSYSFKKMFSSYGVNMQLTKDTVAQSTVTLI